MARQKGIIKLEGTIGDISFYKSKDGFLARGKGGIDGNRIANDPAFARTRENGAEFANAASAGKLLRDTVRVLGMNASDSRVTGRLTQLMTRIKNLDEVDIRGERSVAEGITLPAGKSLLKGFNFNNQAVLGSVLYKPFQVDVATGKISIWSIVTQDEIAFPQGATHVIFKSGYASIDFVTGASELKVSEALRLAINPESQVVSIVPESVPSITGTRFILLCIEFVQEVNGADYSLKNGAYNVLSVVEVVDGV